MMSRLFLAALLFVATLAFTQAALIPQLPVDPQLANSLPVQLDQSTGDQSWTGSVTLRMPEPYKSIFEQLESDLNSKFSLQDGLTILKPPQEIFNRIINSFQNDQQKLLNFVLSLIVKGRQTADTLKQKIADAATNLVNAFNQTLDYRAYPNNVSVLNGGKILPATTELSDKVNMIDVNNIAQKRNETLNSLMKKLNPLYQPFLNLLSTVASGLAEKLKSSNPNITVVAPSTLFLQDISNPQNAAQYTSMINDWISKNVLNGIYSVEDLKNMPFVTSISGGTFTLAHSADGSVSWQGITFGASNSFTYIVTGGSLIMPSLGPEDASIPTVLPISTIFPPIPTNEPTPTFK
ncbi:hypothetical protein CHUAL_008786 [Chamberlinius hualienensis]